MRTAIFLIVVTALAIEGTALAQTPSWTGAWSLGAPGVEVPRSVRADAAGNVYLCGYAFEPGTEIAPTLPVLSRTPSGTLRWIRTAITGVMSLPGAMDADAAGNVYVATSFAGSTAIIDSSGTLIEIEARPFANLLVQKYDSDGRLQWYRTAYASDSLNAIGIAVTQAGVWVGGLFRGSADFGGSRIESSGGVDGFLTMLDTSGMFRRAVRFGGTADESLKAVAASGDGGIYTLGRFSGTARFGERELAAQGDENYFLARFGADGTAAWAVADGGPNYEPMGEALACGPDGSAYVGVSYFGAMRIGDRTFNAQDESDGVVARYGPDGARSWTSQFQGPMIQQIQGLAAAGDGTVFVGGMSQSLPEGTVFAAKLNATGGHVWQVNNEWGDALGGAEAGPICLAPGGVLYVAGSFSGQTRFGAVNLVSVGSTPTSTVGSDIYWARLGTASGVAPSNERERQGADIAVSARMGALEVAAVPDGPAVVHVSLYSMLGGLLATAEGGVGAALRLDIDDLAGGAYIVVARTARGTVSRPVVIVR